MCVIPNVGLGVALLSGILTLSPIDKILNLWLLSGLATGSGRRKTPSWDLEELSEIIEQLGDTLGVTSD